MTPARAINVPPLNADSECLQSACELRHLSLGVTRDHTTAFLTLSHARGHSQSFLYVLKVRVCVQMTPSTRVVIGCLRSAHLG